MWLIRNVVMWVLDNSMNISYRSSQSTAVIGGERLIFPQEQIDMEDLENKDPE